MEVRDTRIMPGARALRGRAAPEEELLARPDRPRRWTLPITALRVIPPSSPAIWLADRPSAQSFFRRSTRSSVQPIVRPPRLAPRRIQPRCPGSPMAARNPQAVETLGNSPPPHEMSYATV